MASTFWPKVAVGEDDECWPWTAYRNAAGYGIWHPAAKVKFMAHRFAYEQVNGDIAEDLVIDHLCRNPSCCNPAHMEPVTIGENVMRGNTIPAHNKLKTACPKGHPYTSENIRRRKNGHRECRTCDLERKRVHVS